MWFRKTTDPLGKMLFERYRMHVFKRPCEDMSVFQVFAVSNGEAVHSGSIESFLRTDFDKPEVKEGEKQLDIDTTTSNAVSANIGLTFLQGFFSLIGTGIMKSVSLLVESSHVQALRFRFGQCTRDYVEDDFELDWRLSELDLNKEMLAFKEGYRYYIATGVHYCRNLSFEILDENKKKIDLSGEIVALGGTGTGISVDKKKRITASADQTLAYGVELNEIIYNGKKGRLQLQESKNYIHTKASTNVTLPKAMIGGLNDMMILNLVK